jgi:hypothetical protein
MYKVDLNIGHGSGHFMGLLGLTFVILKLCKVITWSWLWVLSPFWGPIAIVAAVFIIFGIVIVLDMIVQSLLGH